MLSEAGADPIRTDNELRTRHQRAVGEASVVFGPAGGISGAPTRIRRLHQSGCLRLRFPRLPQTSAEAILVNTAGGLTGGDRLAQEFELEPDGALTVTTQACERIYRSISGAAELRTTVRLGPAAQFAYLPQETILFDGGRLMRSLDLDVDASSRFVLTESVILGRDAMGERVHAGQLRDRWRVRRDGRLVFADDLRMEGDIDALTREPARLGGLRAFATILWQADAPETMLPPLREILGEDGGASSFEGLGVARLVAASGYALRKRLVPALALLAHAPLPRVWSL